MTPLVPFGETVLYLPLKVVRRSKGDTAMKYGIWLGVIERTEEVLIGTRQGVVKCRTVTRLPDGEKWRADVIESMKGLPWEPVPGRQSATIPVAIQENGDVIADEAEAKQMQRRDNAEEDEDIMRHGVTPDKMHVSRKAIAKYGKTEGCPACDAI